MLLIMVGSLLFLYLFMYLFIYANLIIGMESDRVKDRPN
jgi:hypothetical protein